MSSLNESTASRYSVCLKMWPMIHQPKSQNPLFYGPVRRLSYHYTFATYSLETLLRPLHFLGPQRPEKHTRPSFRNQNSWYLRSHNLQLIHLRRMLRVKKLCWILQDQPKFNLLIHQERQIRQQRCLTQTKNRLKLRGTVERRGLERKSRPKVLGQERH